VPGDGGVSMDVAPMVREVATMLASVIPSGIEIDVVVEPGVPRVNIGATDLHQVIVNLAVNARDAMGESGHLDITVRSVHCAREVCSACLEVFSGDYVEIRCRDDGDGMDVDLQRRIFDPFFTTKEVGKGTGMGLSVVHGIVHRAGGHVLVESAKGLGTAFRLLLPSTVAAPERSDVEARPPAVALPPVRGARVLVVDDEPMVRTFLRELLDGQGYRVELAGDGAEALALLRERSTDFDLIVTDQTMPHLSGVGLARAVRQLRPSLPVVLCSGYGDAVDIGAARTNGVQRFLRKPVESETMLRVIAELVDRRLVS
jgi:CheY-like chemotaxis protein